MEVKFCEEDILYESVAKKSKNANEIKRWNENQKESDSECNSKLKGEECGRDECFVLELAPTSQ